MRDAQRVSSPIGINKLELGNNPTLNVRRHNDIQEPQDYLAISREKEAANKLSTLNNAL